MSDFLMDRRRFLERTGLALMAGLVVGDQAVALYERLTHRKVWALGSMTPLTWYRVEQRIRLDASQNETRQTWISRLEAR